MIGRDKVCVSESERERESCKSATKTTLAKKKAEGEASDAAPLAMFLISPRREERER